MLSVLTIVRVVYDEGIVESEAATLEELADLARRCKPEELPRLIEILDSAGELMISAARLLRPEPASKPH